MIEHNRRQAGRAARGRQLAVRSARRWRKAYVCMRRWYAGAARSPNCDVTLNEGPQILGARGTTDGTEGTELEGQGAQEEVAELRAAHVGCGSIMLQG